MIIKIRTKMTSFSYLIFHIVMNLEKVKILHFELKLWKK